MVACMDWSRRHLVETVGPLQIGIPIQNHLDRTAYKIIFKSRYK